MTNVNVLNTTTSYKIGSIDQGSWGDLPNPKSIKITKASKKKIKGTLTGTSFGFDTGPSVLPDEFDFQLTGKFKVGSSKKSIPSGTVKTAQYTKTKGAYEGFAIDRYTIIYSGLQSTVSDFLSTDKSSAQHEAFVQGLFATNDTITGPPATWSASGGSVATGPGNDLVNLYTEGGGSYGSGQPSEIFGANAFLGDGDDIINHLGAGKVIAYGGSGADTFKPSINGYMEVMDFQEGVDAIDVRGIAFDIVYSTDESFTPALEGFSLVTPDGREFARFNYATPFVFF